MNVKMSIIIGILTFISRINDYGDLNVKITLILVISIFMSSLKSFKAKDPVTRACMKKANH